MVTLELFLTPHCFSAPSALALAQEAVRQVPGIKMIIRSDKEDRARAKSRGIFIYPTFVLDGKILSTGEPPLNVLIQTLKDRIRELKGQT